jgi:tetratricopeptide (TPR) repeat protein
MQPRAAAASERWEAALCCNAEGRFAEALELLGKPPGDSAEVALLRADLLMTLDRPHEAASSYAAAASSDTRNVYAQHRLAACLRRLKRWEQAEESYRKVLALDPDSDGARIGLGHCLLHMNRPEGALACFDACHPESASIPVWFGRAVALQMVNRWEEAEAMFGRVLQVQPHSEETLSNLIALNVERFDLARVERYATELLRLCPDSLVALQALTMAAFEQHKYEAASDYYFEWRDNLPEGGVSAREDEIQNRLSRENVARLIEIRTQKSRRGSARWAQAGD